MLSLNPVAHKVNTILVPWESYLFLQDESRRQRSEEYKPRSDRSLEMLHRSFKMNSHNGLHELKDYDLGGCNGDPRNAWEERRWTSWSVQKMAEMLEENGLGYTFGAEKEIISL